MKLSCIIPLMQLTLSLFNLRHLLTQHWCEPWEVIVSNNGSTDETVAIVEQYQEKLSNLRIVDSSDQRGSTRQECWHIGCWRRISIL